MSALPSLSRASAVPEKNPRLQWIETVDANASIRFRVWSPAIWQMWTHFKGKTKPCFENHDLCEGGHDEKTMRWYGYVYGWHEARNGPAFIQLTTGAARTWLKQVASGVSLRGMIITVSRGPKKQGPQRLRVDKFCSTDAVNMGADLDPQHSLFRLWQVNHLGHAFSLSLVSEPEEIPVGPDDEICLKTDSPALSIMEGKCASSRKKRSKKHN